MYKYPVVADNGRHEKAYAPAAGLYPDDHHADIGTSRRNRLSILARIYGRQVSIAISDNY